MPSVTRKLAHILQSVRRPGDFYVTGKSGIFAPNLEVTGVGSISLPLLPLQAKELIAVAEQAPYGRGGETVVDTAVRRTWQIGLEHLRIGGRHWVESLSAIVTRAAAGLGVMEPVTAELYKLLIYESDGFFVDHRDTEKTPGMFATLAITLPSHYTGGELIVRHGEREVCLDLSCQEAAEVSFAAFYADCVHEVRPLTSGYRLALIYNLIRTGPGQLPEPPAYDEEAARVTELLCQWASAWGSPKTDAPDKLIYPLEHAYTPAEIGFGGLKNADAAVAAVLLVAAGRADCELHLALVAIEENGSAEYAGSWSGRRRYTEERDEEFEIGEIIERSLTLSEWRQPDGSQPALAALPFEEEELCPPEAFEGVAPDEEYFHEATGNEGASFERRYQRAALVLWPRSRKLDIIAGGGRAVSLPYLETLARRWVESGEAEDSPLWREAHRLATLIAIDWSPLEWRPYSPQGQATQMLTSLSQLQDREGIASFLDHVSARGAYDSGDNEALAQALTLLPPQQASELLERVIARNAPQQAGACADLLARLSTHWLANTPEAMGLLQPSASALVAALPGDPALLPKPESWRLLSPLKPDLLTHTLTALCHLNATALGEQAVDHVLAWPKTFPPDAILVPAARKLSERGGTPGDWAPTRRLVAACLAHLEKRIAAPLAPPPDFARESKIACTCPHCTELSAFLGDPVRKVWIFKAAEAKRRHVEASLRQHHCDVDFKTERQGSPHALVCTKNQASFERRLAERKKDLQDRACLKQPPAA